MSLARGKFGVEYNPRSFDEDSPGAGWIVVVVMLAALVLVSLAVLRRFASGSELDSDETPRVVERVGAAPVTNAAPPVVRTDVIVTGSENVRPRAVQNLLLKLDKVSRDGDVELQVSTIEQLRAMPGGAVADLDDQLARRLGALNVQRLFVRKNRQWVCDVSVRRGDSASRIAYEHGSTLASLMKLNALATPDRIRIGQTLCVMDHPKFSLVVHRVTKVADLSLKGRFFKRYDLVAPVAAAEGSYETPQRLRAFLSEKGLVFGADDRAELELLLPAGTPIVVSEL